MKQISFVDAVYAGERKKTRREAFLDEMERVAPWTALLKVIEPFYPVAGNGRRPYPLAMMLREHLMQNWFALSNLWMARRRLLALTGFPCIDRRVGTFATLVLFGALSGAGGGSATPLDCVSLAASDAARQRCSAKAGDFVTVTLSELRPTQPSLGYDELDYTLGRYQLGMDTINKRFDDWCEANGQEAALAAGPSATIKDATTFTCKVALGAETKATIDVMKTAVIGPRGVPFLTDGHHTLTSFYETPDGGATVKVRVRILGNLSDYNDEEFWAEMEKRQWTWLRDTDDKRIMPAELPSDLGRAKFANDRYRGVLYFGRDIGYQQLADNAVFQEFYWGRWLRAQPTIKLTNYNTAELGSYLALIKDITKAQTAMADGDIVSDGKTAKELGKLANWNAGAAETAGEFGKLSKAYTESKPGKIAYALKYKKLTGMPQ